MFVTSTLIFNVGPSSSARCIATRPLWHLTGDEWDVEIEFPMDSLCMALSIGKIAKTFRLAYPTSSISVHWPILKIYGTVFTKGVDTEVSSIMSSITYTLPTLKTMCQMQLRAKRNYQHELFLQLLTRTYDIPSEELKAIDNHKNNLLRVSQNIRCNFALRRITL